MHASRHRFIQNLGFAVGGAFILSFGITLRDWNTIAIGTGLTVAPGVSAAQETGSLTRTIPKLMNPKVYARNFLALLGRGPNMEAGLESPR